MAMGQGLAPACFFCSQTQHVGKARLVTQQSQAVLVRVFAGSRRQFINEALISKGVHVRAYCTPVAYADTGVDDVQIVPGIGNLIPRHGCLTHERVECFFREPEGALCNRL